MNAKQVLSTILGAVLFVGAQSAFSAQYNASNSSQLDQALDRARGGDTITLAAGANFGSFVINDSKYPNLGSNRSMITIRSASTSKRAYFTGLSVKDVQYLRFSGVKFDSSNARINRPFNFEGGQYIEVTSSLIQGKASNRITGLRMVQVDHLNIANNSFVTLWESLDVGNASDITIVDNLFQDGAFDSIHLGASVRDLLIEGNTIRARPYSASAHVDLIQFTNQNPGNGPSNGVIVRGNDIRAYNGVGIHGIYFGNYDAQQNNGRDKGDWYQNILIQDNYIETTHMTAIAVSYANKVQIIHNTAKRPPAYGTSSSTISKPTILVETANTGVSILRNTTVTPPRAGHLVSGWSTDKEIPSSWNIDFNRF